MENWSYFRIQKILELSLFILWILCQGAICQGSTHYCPENGETVTITVSGPTQLRTVFAKDKTTYRQNQNCRWIIDSGDPDKRIQISVVESDLQWTPPNPDCTMYDYIELRDGENSASPLVTRWCGSSNPYTVISKRNWLYVYFVSDDVHLTENRGVTLDVAVFSVASSGGSCPLGWVSPSAASESCYSVKKHAATWKDAQDFCINDQANLVTLSDATEQNFVLNAAKGALVSTSYDSVWIGLNDILKEGEYVWVDGSIDDKVFSSTVVPSRPEKYKDCMLVQFDTGLWRESHCHRPEQTASQYPFVCERRRDGTTIPQPSPPVEAITYYCQDSGKILFITSAESARIQTREEGTSTYGQNLNCRWVINSGLDPHKRIHINVTNSDLQWTPSDANCYGYDHVKVLDGPNEDSPALSVFCGKMNPYSLISSSNVLYISFTSKDRQVYNLPGVTLDFSFFSVAPSQQECPPGWISDSPSGSYCYSIKTHVETWMEAQQFCNNDQANLVSFETEEEEKFIIDYAVQTLTPLQYTKMWIGLNDIADEGKMVWIDGIESTVQSRILVKPYTSSVYEDCVVVQLGDREWKEQFCSTGEVQTTSKYPFACKRRRDGKTELHAIPRSKGEKEGPKGKLAPKPLIIFGVVVAILAVIGLGVGAYFLIKRKTQGRREYTSPSHHAYQTSASNAAAQEEAAVPSAPHDMPPPYEEAIEAPVKTTPI